MPRVRIPLSAKVRDGTGTEYRCFAEGYARGDDLFDVRLAFSLPDESTVHRTPPLGTVQAEEEALTAWAHALSFDAIEAALADALRAMD